MNFLNYTGSIYDISAIYNIPDISQTNTSYFHLLMLFWFQFIQFVQIQNASREIKKKDHFKQMLKQNTENIFKHIAMYVQEYIYMYIYIYICISIIMYR